MAAKKKNPTNMYGFTVDELPFTLEIDQQGNMEFVQKYGERKRALASAGLAMQYISIFNQNMLAKQITRLVSARGNRNVQR